MILVLSTSHREHRTRPAEALRNVAVRTGESGDADGEQKPGRSSGFLMDLGRGMASRR
jgi:hypothetical protein